MLKVRLSTLQNNMSLTEPEPAHHDVGNDPLPLLLLRRLPTRRWEVPPEDGHSWLKYGAKRLSTPVRTRGYYRCALHKKMGCPAKKMVDFPPATSEAQRRQAGTSEAERCQVDSASEGAVKSVTEYLGCHNHPPSDSRTMLFEGAPIRASLQVGPPSDSRSVLSSSAEPPQPAVKKPSHECTSVTETASALAVQQLAMESGSQAIPPPSCSLQMASRSLSGRDRLGESLSQSPPPPASSALFLPWDSISGNHCPVQACLPDPLPDQGSGSKGAGVGSISEWSLLLDELWHEGNTEICNLASFVTGNPLANPMMGLDTSMARAQSGSPAHPEAPSLSYPMPVRGRRNVADTNEHQAHISLQSLCSGTPTLCRGHKENGLPFQGDCDATARQEQSLLGLGRIQSQSASCKSFWPSLEIVGWADSRLESEDAETSKRKNPFQESSLAPRKFPRDSNITGNSLKERPAKQHGRNSEFSDQGPSKYQDLMDVIAPFMH